MFSVDASPLTRAAAAARWLAYEPPIPDQLGRTEMDEYGEFFVAPLPTNRHQITASRIAAQMERQLGGTGLTGIGINTRIGVRIPDVCWTGVDAGRFEEDPAPSAPEICVEVRSPSNTEKWLLEKAAAYLDAGAREVVIVELDGRIRYFDSNGERPTSAYGLALAP